MNETLSNEDRHHIRTALMASLAFVFTLLLGTFALAGGTPPAGETRVSSVLVAIPVAAGASEEPSNATMGCGCAESCFASN